MKLTFKHKSGVVHLIVVLVVLVASFVLIAVVFKVLPRIKAQLTGKPQGQIVASPTSTSNTGSIVFKAKDVVGVSGAQIDYVRFYLLNPKLAVGNTWGNPNWCADQVPCTQSTNAPFKTYDFGESSNPANDFEITWNSNSKSPDSTGTDRSLVPGNIPVGQYTVGLKIRDVDGNENGGASTVIITIEAPVGNLQVNPSTAANNGSVKFTATGVNGAGGAAIDNVRYYLYNPLLATGHNWGDPSWCSNGSPCTKDNHPGIFTYDISESSNPANNYEIVWDANTHSSGSTSYSRALTSANIPPGVYRVGLRVEDVNGNVNGQASALEIKVTNSQGQTSAFTAQYFDNIDFTNLKTTKTEQTIRYVWGSAVPDPLISPDTYSVRWSGTFNFDTDTYRFNTQTDGQAKVFVDGVKVIDRVGGTTGTNQAALKMTAGVHEIKVEYAHNTGSARMLANFVKAYSCFDMTADGSINSADLGVVSSHFGSTPIDPNPWDVNGDKIVTSADLGLVASKFGTKC